MADPHSNGPSPPSLPTVPAPYDHLELQLKEVRAVLQRLTAGLPVCEEMMTQPRYSISTAAASPVAHRADAVAEVREVATQPQTRIGIEAAGESSAGLDSASALRSQLADLRAALTASERETDEAWQAAHAADQRMHEAVRSQQATVARLQAALASHAGGLDVREAAVRGAEALLRDHVSQWRELMELGTPSSPAAADARRVALAATSQFEQEQSARRAWQQRAEAAEAELHLFRLRADAAANMQSLQSLHARFSGGNGADAVRMGMATPVLTPVTTARAVLTDPPVGVARAIGSLVAHDSQGTPTHPAPAVQPFHSGGFRAPAPPAQGCGTAGRPSLLSHPAIRLLLSEVEALQAEITLLQPPIRRPNATEGTDAAWAERWGAERRRQSGREVRLAREAARAADLEAELQTTRGDLIDLHRLLGPVLHQAMADATHALPGEMRERVAVAMYSQLSDEQMWLALHGCGARVPRTADRLQLCVLCSEHGIDVERLVPAAWAKSPAGEYHGAGGMVDGELDARVPLSLGGGESGEGFIREAAWMASPHATDAGEHRNGAWRTIATDAGEMGQAGWAGAREERKPGAGAAGRAASACVHPLSPLHDASMLDPPPPHQPPRVYTPSEEIDWDSEEGRRLAVQMFARARKERADDPTVALQRDRLMRDAWFREMRWAATREVLVGLACAMRDRTFLASVFYAWATYRWRRAALLASDAPGLPHWARRSLGADDRPPLLILTSLEHHRVRLTQLLHEAHTENRWLRQFFSGTAAHKQQLLAWAGDSRLLQRCWLAWGAHITRGRMAREHRGHVHQLAFALRVASLSQAPDMAFRAGGRPYASESLALFAGYTTRRAWTAWRAAVTLARIEAQYQQRVEATLNAERQRLQRPADATHPCDGGPPAMERRNGGEPAESFSLLRLLSSSAPSFEDGQARWSATGGSAGSTPSEGWRPDDWKSVLRPATSAEATRLQLARHRDTRALSIAFFGWRIVKTSAKLRQMQACSVGRGTS
jgi:hypothetical protein